MIDTNLPLPTEIPEEGKDFNEEFRRKSFAAWAWFKDFATQLKATIPQINSVFSIINSIFAQINSTKELIEANKEVVLESEQNIINKIDSLVLPEETTYNIDTIDEMFATLANETLKNKAQLEGLVIDLI